ncbi:hypothetical protein PXK56_18145 [Phaeobacter gallaeciensis]|uniref:hypothetical protein n=1 Tax=Phaeobacter gallaeciensis TaxID=60890 RepID=UPI00237FFF70|nr:hypothetical protein [Phaeobacter gallaeciensis]MDE4297112.1 hypothetical protein [Phaeobacter gallaeciensis]
MTTIVYRDGVLAADTRAYSGNPTPIGSKQKIHMLADGSIAGVSTTKPGISEAFIAWLNDGGDLGDTERLGSDLDLQALVVKQDGSVFYYHDSVVPSGPLYGQYFAIGSGDQYALGALSCGATADGAVAAASQHDPWTGGEIMKISLRPEATEDAIELEPAPEPKKRKSRKKQLA